MRDELLEVALALVYTMSVCVTEASSANGASLLMLVCNSPSSIEDWQNEAQIATTSLYYEYEVSCCFHSIVTVNAFLMPADEGTGLQRPAGRLLNILWQLQPSLVTDFVSKKNAPPLLKRLAAVRSHSESLVMVQLVQSIWSFTASLASEPLLVKAIDRLVQACKAPQGEPLRPLLGSDRQTALDLQVSFLLNTYWILTITHLGNRSSMFAFNARVEYAGADKHSMMFDTLM